MGRALGPRERNRRPTRDARRRAIPAKPESKLPNRIDAPGRAGRVDRETRLTNSRKNQRNIRRKTLRRRRNFCFSPITSHSSLSQIPPSFFFPPHGANFLLISAPPNGAVA
jgi:hypothetical protein